MYVWNIKGQFQILKSGIRLLGVLKVDDVWKTCCALHNWLLEIDGISTVWENGVHVVVSDWDGPMGDLDFDGVRKDIPNSIAWLSNSLDSQNVNLSGTGDFGKRLGRRFNIADTVVSGSSDDIGSGGGGKQSFLSGISIHGSSGISPESRD